MTSHGHSHRKGEGVAGGPDRSCLAMSEPGIIIDPSVGERLAC